MNKRDIAIVVKPLSPTAARILLALMLGKGASFTGVELSRMLGKSQNTISTAVGELEYFGYAQNNGRNHGWSLPAKHLQLDLGSMAGENGSAWVSSRMVPAADLPALQGEEPAENQYPEIQKNLEFQKNLDFVPSSSSSFKEKERKKERKENGTAEIQKNLDFNPEVHRMLVEAGVGPRSKKLFEILDLDPKPDFVADHIHAWKVQREPVSWLITRLLAGEAPPVCKCHDCRLKSPIPEQYRGIIEH